MGGRDLWEGGRDLLEKSSDVASLLVGEDVPWSISPVGVYLPFQVKFLMHICSLNLHMMRFYTETKPFYLGRCSCQLPVQNELAWIQEYWD